MKTKNIIKAVLLVFVAASLGWAIINQGQARKTGAESNTPITTGTSTSDVVAEPTSGKSNKTPLPNRIIVYYFHTTYRCPTCYKIEQYTKEAVEAGFSQALSEGRLQFLALNVEESANTHFVQDYKLYTKSVVVADIKEGKQVRWKNLEKVWEFVGNKQDFFKYIQDEVNLYLQGK
jgi:hypothetical protein